MLCQGKNEKLIPGGFFSKDKKVLENCLNEAKGSGNYCEIHGCFDCSLKPVEACSEHDGVKLCLICTAKRVFKKSQEKEKQKKEEAEKRRLAEEARKKAEEDKRKQQEDIRERERERERANLLIQEIKAELASSPSVNITELPSTYHNYETWTVNDLVNGKDAIIKAIQTKRVQKQLQGLLNQANNCSDSDLWNFIQKLEKLLSNTASPTEQAFYSTHQNLVDATLSGLKQRWNNLSEAQKLVGYWNNAIQNFANWLKEAENLQLAADDPFANFKENIKKEKTPAAIANQEKEAYQHILNVFKEVVKQSLGLEQQSGEYQEIEHGQNFAEVKLAWNNIQRSRQNSDSPTLPNNNAPNVPSPSPEKPRDKKKDGPKSSPNHSSNLTSKIVMGTTTIIGGSVILVLVGMIMKRWKSRRKKKR